MSPEACPSCGNPVTQAVRGLCSRCLLRTGLALDDDPDLPADDPEEPDPTPSHPPRIGRYDIVRVLGEGGMGMVYLAEQWEPIHRLVAVKVVKPGMDSRDVLARFQAERQTLALMNHPHIASVLDAGATTDGKPYFVMEYVPGEPITTFSETRRAGLEERLDLYLQACEAIQHAHQKGVLHRDVKPLNVLVAMAGGRPRTKIIDFGIARAIDPQGTLKGITSIRGQVVGTPEYMSPEQAAGRGQAMDTRTDVYSLGLLLYELLVGVLPFPPPGAEDLETSRRRVAEEDPPRPSLRWQELGPEEAATAAMQRRTDPRAWQRRLKGDLDWITLKALERDPGRRYGSPGELADDLRRHLARQPVLAGPPGAAYRISRFIRRHPVGVGAATAAALGLILVAVMSGVQARRLAHERDRASQESEVARQVASFLVDLFEVSDPDTARGSDLSAREILDKGAARIDTELAGQPAVQARLLLTMGVVYKKMGRFDSADPLLSRALESCTALFGPHDPATLEAALEMGEMHFARGRLDDARATLQLALEGARVTGGSDSLVALTALSDLSVIAQYQGNMEEAERLGTEALAGRRRILGPDHPETLETTNNLGALLFTLGRFADAEPHFRAALEGRRRALGADHPEAVDSAINLGTLLRYLDRPEEAEAMVREAVEVGRRVRPDHPKTITSIQNLATILEWRGKSLAAEPLYQEAIEAFKRSVGEGHPDTLTAMGNLGDLYTRTRRPAQGEPLLRDAAALARLLPQPHMVTGYTLRKYGRCLSATGQIEQAEKLLLEAREVLVATVGDAHPMTREADADLAGLYETTGRPDQAARFRPVAAGTP